MTKARDLSKSSAAELSLAGGAMTGAITTNSTFDGRDVAADGVLATNAMPKGGGAFSGAVTTNSTFDGRDVAADGVLATNAMPKAGGAFSGAVTTNSTFDGRDVAADGVLATNAMPKAGGAFSGAVTTNSTFDGRDVAADGVLATNAMPKGGGAFTGAVTTNSTIDGRDVAADGVLATNALPKAGGTMTGDTLHGDNVKAKFGTGNDLEIFHDGSHSYIKDEGTGNLILRTAGAAIELGGDGEALATFTKDGSVELYHNNVKKIETTATGVAVTGGLNTTAKTTISIASANGDIIDLKSNNSDVGTIGTLGGATYFGSEDSGIMFNGVNQNPTSGGSTRVDNTNDLGAASYRYKDIYLGGGAFIGGTGTPNKLDDYEEGTWTFAVVGAAGSAGAWAMSGRAARYTKVGRVVHFSATGYLTNLGSYTGSSTLRITGLPFACDSGMDVACSASSMPIGQYNATNYVPQVMASQSYLQVRKNQYGDSTAIYNEQGLNIRWNIAGTYNTA